MVRLILIIYFIKPNISTILAFQHVVNIKKYHCDSLCSFCIKSLKFCVCFTVHLTSDEPPFKCSNSHMCLMDFKLHSAALGFSLMLVTLLSQDDSHLPL